MKLVVDTNVVLSALLKRSTCENFFVFHSDNDTFVSLGNGKKIAEKLQTKLTLVPNTGHFNKAAGYLEFELLFEKIKLALKSNLHK